MLLSCVPASMQAQEGVVLTVGGGAAFPSRSDEFYRYWKPAFSVTGGIEYRFTSVLSLAGRVDYCRFPMNGDLLLSDLGAAGLGIWIEGGEVSLTLISGNLQIYPLPSIPEARPYLIAGAGMASFEVRRIVIGVADTSETVSGVAETAFSITLGAGLAVPLGSRLELFAEGRYVLTYTRDEHTNAVPAIAGIRITF